MISPLPHGLFAHVVHSSGSSLWCLASREPFGVGLEIYSNNLVEDRWVLQRSVPGAQFVGSVDAVDSVIWFARRGLDVFRADTFDGSSANLKSEIILRHLEAASGGRLTHAVHGHISEESWRLASVQSVETGECWVTLESMGSQQSVAAPRWTNCVSVSRGDEVVVAARPPGGDLGVYVLEARGFVRSNLEVAETAFLVALDAQPALLVNLEGRVELVSCDRRGLGTRHLANVASAHLICRVDEHTVCVGGRHGFELVRGIRKQA